MKSLREQYLHSSCCILLKYRFESSKALWTCALYGWLSYDHQSITPERFILLFFTKKVSMVIYNEGG